MSAPVFDVAVIGGGVVGCAILHELTSLGLHCILCEKENDLISGASSGNSGTLHSGFDADLNSRELDCLLRSASLNEGFFERYNIPFKKLGGYIVAWNEEDLAKLPDLVRKSQLAGVPGVKLVTSGELLQSEPHLNPQVLGAVHVPGESIVEPWLIPATLAHVAISAGATVATACNVETAQKQPDHWLLVTSTGLVKSKVVINCAGLFGDVVESIHQQTAPFTIKPRKGQYAVFGQSSGNLLNAIIFPVPTEKTKGILLFPTVYGNIVVGPTAEDQSDRCKAEIDPTVIDSLTRHALFVLPSLKKHSILGTYAGLRPATEHKDYCIQAHEDSWLTVGGIRSTGLSACLGIAKYVAGFLPDVGLKDLQTEGDATPISRKYIGQETVEFNGRGWKITHPITKFGTSTQKGLSTFVNSLQVP